jgi:large subunit ribosomal protein L21
MYAIIRSGGKQYKVEAGDVLRVEKLDRDLGAEFDVAEVLLVGGDKTFVGQPLVKDAKVTVVVTQQAKDSKIVVFKKRRRQGYRRMQGHRQLFTELFVKSITSPEGDVSGSESKPTVIDPVKKQERLTKEAAKGKASKIPKSKKKAARETTASKGQATKKAAARKVAAKGKATKKAGAKKAGKKTAGKKKVAKKATKK